MRFDKNTIIGWLLMLAVMFGFMAYERYTAPTQEELQAQQILNEAQKANEAQKELEQKSKEFKEKEIERTDSLNPLFMARNGEAGTVVIKNSQIALTISNQGGKVVRAEILDSNYRGKEGGNVVLFDNNDSEFAFTLDGKSTNINTADLFFNPQNITDSSVVMSLPVGEGVLEVSYKILPKSYLCKVSVRGKGIEGLLPSSTKTIGINWKENMKQQEKGYDFETRYSTITYRDTQNETEELSSMGGDEENDAADFENKLQWVAYKTQFFSQVLIADKPMTATSMSSKAMEKGCGYLKTLDSQLLAEFDPSGEHPTDFTLYMGPVKFSTLQENETLLESDKNLDLQSLVYLGWPVIRWINRFFMVYLFDWLTSWGINMGIVLILLTLLIKVIVFPLMRKSYMSSARMRVLRPKMDEIGRRYPKPEDAMLKQQEIMKLYSEYGVSPMGGCLPMLIQMPVWIALFNFIPNAIELRGQSFLWADDLSTYDDIINWGFNIWGIGDHLSLFCVLWCLSTIASSWFSMRQQQDSMTPEQAQQMGMMKWMTYLMPIIFFFSFNGYSSGLNFYYFISTLISVIMMYALRATTNDAALLAQLEERYRIRKAEAGTKKRPNSMMERLQAMQEKQMELMRQQQEMQKQNK